jgi:hypothetical protein
MNCRVSSHRSLSSCWTRSLPHSGYDSPSLKSDRRGYLPSCYCLRYIKNSSAITETFQLQPSVDSVRFEQACQRSGNHQESLIECSVRFHGILIRDISTIPQVHEWLVFGVVLDLFRIKNAITRAYNPLIEKLNDSIVWVEEEKRAMTKYLKI